jgi:hypothetical protein
MIDLADFYAHFNAPISAIDCGERCAPYNEGGQPFCCDTRHAVPTAYQAEWEYLRAHTDLWHAWQPADQAEWHSLNQQTPIGQVLIECQGAAYCQRGYRSITCRAFPFFPYFTRPGEFIGLSYYWTYEDRCWVINHLDVVTPDYRQEFIAAYEDLFAHLPSEIANFKHHSMIMRRIFGRQHRAIPLLHRNGAGYKITPRNGRLRRVSDKSSFPKYGPYKIAAKIPFPDEL